MLVQPQLDRRTFLAGLGHGAFAIAIVTIAGCTPGTTTAPTLSASSGIGPDPTPTGPGPCG